jgi:hypothetical protein
MFAHFLGWPTVQGLRLTAGRLQSFRKGGFMKRMTEHPNMPPTVDGFSTDEDDARIWLNEEDEARIRFVAAYLMGRDVNCWYFRGLPLTILKKMMDEGLAAPAERQNDSPAIGEIVEWLQDHPSFTVHGYIKVGRDDRKISVEGVEHKGPLEAHEKNSFKTMFKRADDLIIRKNWQWAWFD